MFLLSACGVALACGLPLWWASFDTAWLGRSYTKTYLRFELLGLTGSVVLFVWAALRLRGLRGLHGLNGKIAVLIPLLTGHYFDTYVSEYSNRTYDYGAYQNAAERLLKGEGLYDGKPPYLYPPLTAQAMAAAYR